MLCQDVCLESKTIFQIAEKHFTTFTSKFHIIRVALHKIFVADYCGVATYFCVFDDPAFCDKCNVEQ